MEAAASQPTPVLFLHPVSKNPAGLDNISTRVLDLQGFCYTGGLAAFLRAGNFDEIRVGGEFLWWRGPNGDDFMKNLEDYRESLSAEKRVLFNKAIKNIQIFDSRMIKIIAKKIGVDPDECVRVLFKGDKLNQGCVPYVCDSLRKEFPRAIIDRELYYPTVEPPKVKPQA